MCCGSNRAAARAAVMAQGARPPTAAPAGHVTASSVIMFEYVGASQAAIRGPISGRLYCFARPGDRLPVDPRDRPGLAAMPALRWVR
jgi:hypothetical protein